MKKVSAFGTVWICMIAVVFGLAALFETAMMESYSEVKAAEADVEKVETVEYDFKEVAAPEVVQVFEGEGKETLSYALLESYWGTEIKSLNKFENEEVSVESERIVLGRPVDNSIVDNEKLLYILPATLVIDTQDVVQFDKIPLVQIRVKNKMNKDGAFRIKRYSINGLRFNDFCSTEVKLKAGEEKEFWVRLQSDVDVAHLQFDKIFKMQLEVGVTPTGETEEHLNIMDVTIKDVEPFINEIVNSGTEVYGNGDLKIVFHPLEDYEELDASTGYLILDNTEWSGDGRTVTIEGYRLLANFSLMADEDANYEKVIKHPGVYTAKPGEAFVISYDIDDFDYLHYDPDRYKPIYRIDGWIDAIYIDGEKVASNVHFEHSYEQEFTPSSVKGSW